MPLATAHLSAMLGDANHKMFDPQLFYADDEMRKQVELMVPSS